MTSRVVVTAHPGSGVTHVAVCIFDDAGHVLEEHLVEKDETREFMICGNRNIEVYETNVEQLIEDES